MDEVARYSFHINSAYRSSGTSTDMNIQLTQIISLQGKNTRFQAIVHGITVPFSFYQLSTDIQNISIQVQNGGSSYYGSLVLTPGNYNVNSINTEIQTKIIAFVLSVTGITPIVTVTYNATTSRTTFAITNAMIITVFFISNKSLGQFFGFSANAVFSNSSTSTGDKTAVANPVNTLFLRSPSLKQYKNREWQTERNVFSDILYRIPILTQQNTYISQYMDSEPVWIVNDNISAMNFYLSTNLSYTPIDLQGLDIQFHFTIIERDIHLYEPITDSLIVNLPTIMPPQNNTELETLQAQKEAILKRIQGYKKKLPALTDGQ